MARASEGQREAGRPAVNEGSRGSNERVSAEKEEEKEKKRRRSRGFTDGEVGGVGGLFYYTIGFRGYCIFRTISHTSHYNIMKITQKQPLYELL